MLIFQLCDFLSPTFDKLFLFSPFFLLFHNTLINVTTYCYVIKGDCGILLNIKVVEIFIQRFVVHNIIYIRKEKIGGRGGEGPNSLIKKEEEK